MSDKRFPVLCCESWPECSHVLAAGDPEQGELAAAVLTLMEAQEYIETAKEQPTEGYMGYAIAAVGIKLDVALAQLEDRAKRRRRSGTRHWGREGRMSAECRYCGSTEGDLVCAAEHCEGYKRYERAMHVFGAAWLDEYDAVDVSVRKLLARDEVEHIQAAASSLSDAAWDAWVNRGGEYES